MKMSMVLSGLVSVLLFAGVPLTMAQESKTEERHGSSTADTQRSRADADVTYGRIKELTPGKKVVIDVDNAIDKSFDLTDKDTRVTLAKSLRVGDPVKVTETDVKGKKTVHITAHSGGGVSHGDRSRTEERSQSDKDKK